MTWTLFFVSWAVLLVGFLVGAAWAGRHRPHVDWQHSFLTGMMSIFHEGEVAHQRGIEFRDNPYFEGTPEYRSWAFGWAWLDERHGNPPGGLGFKEPVQPGD